ncbi:MAG TPA: hypothetical protein VIR30_17300, partial [Nocardioides sp.]
MSQPPTDPHGRPRSFGEESAGHEGDPTAYDASPGHTPGENAVRFAKAGATGVKAVARGTARASKATVRAARRASH